MKTVGLTKADVETTAWLGNCTKWSRNVLMIYFLSFTFQWFLLNNVGAVYHWTAVQIWIQSHSWAIIRV